VNGLSRPYQKEQFGDGSGIHCPGAGILHKKRAAHDARPKSREETPKKTYVSYIETMRHTALHNMIEGQNRIKRDFEDPIAPFEITAK
jgi:hypothetical protein